MTRSLSLTIAMVVSLPVLAAATVGAAPPKAPMAPMAPIASDAEIRRMLATRVDVQRYATGIVVGIVAPGGERVITYGTRGLDDKRAMTADTVFDIGSLTKLFTALLLSDLVTRGQVALDDPLVKYLPDGVRPPERDHRAITLADLATHTAGLPLRPTNLIGTDPDNKYAGYTLELLHQFLAGYPLPRVPGSAYEYSNVGYALLGEAVTHVLGQSYADAVRARITDPLGMRDTRLDATPGMQARAATGYTQDLTPAKDWDLGALAAAGALRSTARDLMRLLEAQLGYRKTPLQHALAAMLDTRRPGGMGAAQAIALGWNIQTVGDHELVWKNGSVGGFRAFIGFEARARVGVVVLANAQTSEGGDDIGLHILNPSLPVDRHVPRPHTAITLAPEVLERYVGRYQFSATDILVVTRDGGQLWGQAGPDKFELFPEAEGELFVKVADAQVSFTTPAGAAHATAAVWHQGGTDQRGERIE